MDEMSANGGKDARPTDVGRAASPGVPDETSPAGSTADGRHPGSFLRADPADARRHPNRGRPGLTQAARLWMENNRGVIEGLNQWDEEHGSRLDKYRTF